MLLMKQEPVWSPSSPDNFTSMKSELGPSLPESSSNIWTEMSPNMFGGQTETGPESGGNSLAESLQSVLQSDKITELLDGTMLYNAFDDIETTEDEGNSPESFELEDQRMTDDARPRMMTEAERDEIRAVVESHDRSYFSVNFGEVLIKDMLMCSMFGVQVTVGY